LEPEKSQVGLVMVFEEGYDRENLEGKNIPPLAALFDVVFTSGI